MSNNQTCCVCRKESNVFWCSPCVTQAQDRLYKQIDGWSASYDELEQQVRKVLNILEDPSVGDLGMLVSQDAKSEWSLKEALILQLNVGLRE